MLSVPPNIKAQNSTSSQQSSQFLSTKQKAEQGDAEAQYELGKMYYNAKGVKIDHVEAIKWYLKAAEQGYVDAQYELGFCYELGFGVTKDEREALR
jgi:uncharacterized protein